MPEEKPTPTRRDRLTALERQARELLDGVSESGGRRSRSRRRDGSPGDLPGGDPSSPGAVLEDRAEGESVEGEDRARAGRGLDPALVRSLAEHRVVPLFGFIDEALAARVTAQLLVLAEESDPVLILINSPGGVVTSGLAIVDMMRAIASPTWTLCMGQANSMAAVVLAAGDKGHRAAFPHARMMIHQPFHMGTGERGAAPLGEREAAPFSELEHAKTTIATLLAEATGKALPEVLSDIAAERYLGPEDAMRYGLIDEIRTRLGLPFDPLGTTLG